MHKKATLPLIMFAALLALPTLAQAMPTMACHCFQNREFDPDRPGAADTYLLTTTFNSFQAHALNIDKKSIVRAKMSGEKSGDIWLRHWLAKKAGRSVAWAEQQRRETGSWLKAAQDAGVEDIDALSPAQPINDDSRLAAAVARDWMKRYFGVGNDEIAELQEMGASLKEMTLSFFLAATAQEPAAEIFERAHDDGMTWGLAAQEAGIVFSTIETRLGKLAKNTR